MLCRYNIINVLTNIYKRHPIAHLLGWSICGVSFCWSSIWLIFCHNSSNCYVISYNIGPCYNGTHLHVEKQRPSHLEMKMNWVYSSTAIKLQLWFNLILASVLSKTLSIHPRIILYLHGPGTPQNFLQNYFNRHSIACTWGQAIGCLLWLNVWCMLIYVVGVICNILLYWTMLRWAMKMSTTQPAGVIYQGQKD